MAERIIPQRFFDANEEQEDEHDQTLIPIKEYENFPLVSLKNAIKPIKHLLYNIDASVKAALKNCQNPADGLTQDESSAIHLYTIQWPQPHPSLFTLVNKILRSKNRNEVELWFPFLKLFLTALSKLPSFQGFIYRGVRGNLLDRYKNDNQIWCGLSSCSERLDVIKTFIGPNSDRTIFNIECLNGKFIRSHSYFQHENEVLLLPGTYVQVVSKLTSVDGLTIIHLREKVPHSPMTIISIERFKSQFKQNGKIVAGGNGKGKKLNQLSSPAGIFVDKNKTIFIADSENHRIVQWKSDENIGQIVAGGNGKGMRIDQLNQPTDFVVGQQNHSLTIADQGNQRVMRWFADQTQQILAENIDCSRLTIDKYGSLYVSDYVKNQVRRWKIGEQGNGTLVAGGNGCGKQLNQFSSPTHIFVDDNQSIYISDLANDRVMKWRKDAHEGIVVAGGNGRGNNLNQLNRPQGLFIDRFYQIYVADYGNHRIVRWCEGKQEGEIVISGNGLEDQMNQLSFPTSLTFDLEGNLYVSNWGNSQIVRYDLVS